MIPVDIAALIGTCDAELEQAKQLHDRSPSDVTMAIVSERARVRDRLIRRRDQIAVNIDPDARARERSRLLYVIYPLHKVAFDAAHRSIGSSARPLRPLGMGDFAERALASLLRESVALPTEDDLRHVLAVRHAEAIATNSVRFLGASVWTESSYSFALSTTPEEVGRAPRRGTGRAGDELQPQLAKIRGLEAKAIEPHDFRSQPGNLGHLCRTCGHESNHTLHGDG